MPIISPKIPSGLEELMRGLAKSCIKENPENIYTFAAEYFENLLKDRDGTVDQSYKKFATYKVYKKNKSARLKREKENSNDVNDVPSDNGFKKDGNAVNYVDFKRKDSVEEIVLPESSSQPLQTLPKTQSSISIESELNTEVKKEALDDIEGALSQEDDDDVKNMVLDEDMANAALKIQASFRGHKVRREMKDAKLECDDEESLMNEQLDAEAQLGEEEEEAGEIISGEEELVDGEEIFEPEAEIKQVTKNDSQCIVESEQGSEKALEEITTDFEASEPEQDIDTGEMSDEPIKAEIDDEIANMVLDDEMAEAALKIQATFRGHKTRQQMKKSSVDNAAEEVMQTTDAQQEAEEDSEQTLGVEEDEVLEVEDEAIVVESDELEREIVEEGEIEVASERMAEDFETNEDILIDSETPIEMEAMSESQIEETLLKKDSMILDNVQETEIAVEGDNEETPAEDSLETEKIAEISENVDDASIKGEVLEEAKADMGNVTESLEEQKINVINDEDITAGEDINRDEALTAEATQSTEVVDESLIELLPSVEAIEAENSTAGDFENIDETLLALDEIENAETQPEITNEEKQISDEIKFERPPTIENELNSIEQTEAKGEELTPEEIQDETIKTSFDDVENLEREQSVVDEATIEEALDESLATKNLSEEEKPIEGKDVIELTDNLKTSITEGENVNESENYEVKPQENEPFETIEEGKNVEVNEQEPQEGLNELPNENETENLDNNVALTFDDIDGGKVPVVEEICEKKSFGMLEPDQENLESEIVEFPLNEIGTDEAEVEGGVSGIKDNLEKLPSGDVEYSPLKESMSEHDADSVDEVDNKSRDLTDEKSIDNDTTGSRQNSLDEISCELQKDVNEQLVADEQQKSESFVHSSTLDNIEIIATPQTEQSCEPIESIFQTEISPIELMDEIVNECAGAVANEIFTNNAEPVESNLIKSVESEKAENAEAEIVEPKLMEENPLQEILSPKSIDLTQESIQRSEDEMEPIRDEILKPEGEESEIPEETQAPQDENIPKVSMEEKSPSIGNDEGILQKSAEKENSEEKAPQVEDDVLDMVLDEEMEDAALKIQAAFRGHKVRQEEVTQQSGSLVEEENTQDDESQKVDLNLVIDQCSEENVETQDNEENEQQDTSADCEEIQDSETVDQEETQEGKQLGFVSR
jgi:IQ calmodulin-binding motif